MDASASVRQLQDECILMGSLPGSQLQHTVLKALHPTPFRIHQSRQIAHFRSDLALSVAQFVRLEDPYLAKFRHLGQYPSRPGSASDDAYMGENQALQSRQHPRFKR